MIELLKDDWIAEAWLEIWSRLQEMEFKDTGDIGQIGGGVA